MSALTKMFIVLQLVFSLACSIVLVMMISKQENYKTGMDAANSAKVGLAASYAKSQGDLTATEASLNDVTRQLAQANNDLQKATASRDADTARLQAQVLELQAANADQKARLAQLTTQNTTLTATLASANEELSKNRPEVAKLLKDNADLNRAINEANNQLRAAEQAIRKLQEQIASATPGTGPGASGTIGSQVQPLATGNTGAMKVNSQISDIGESAGRTIIELPMGSRDGMQRNTHLMIYRGNGYIGDAVVQQVTPDRSVAVVTSTKQGESVQKGDLVSTTNQ